MAAKNIVVAPDSFKSSLTAREAATALSAGLERGRADLQIVLAPMADGGEGTLDCVAAALPARHRRVRLRGVHGRTITAPWLVLDDGRAVVESATVLGLPLIAATAPPVQARGSAALGRLIQAALANQPSALIIGLGGSACNDAGLGCLLALGCRGYDAAGRPVTPDMNGLLRLRELDWRGLDTRLASTPLICLCDVDNPLLGPAGSTRTYGPQKGLDDDRIDAVEAAARHFADLCGPRAEAERPGSGAAGGLGFALACVGAQLTAGAPQLLHLTGMARVLAGADVVITGEGRADRQTLSGKLPLAVARAAAPTPTILVAGTIEREAYPALEQHFSACHDLSLIAGSEAAALTEPARWLATCGARIARAL